MSRSSSGLRRALIPVGLVVATIAGLWLVGAEVVPWLWVRLFPSPEENAEASKDAPSTVDGELTSRALDQAVVAAGGELPPRPGAGEAAVVPLPRGMSPKALERALRDDPRLRGTSIYVTRADSLLWNLRIFEGSELLLLRELRPWLPESPPHPPDNPPELVLLVDLRGHKEGERVLRWRSPLGVVVEPFAPPTMRVASDAAKASRSVVGALRVDEPFPEQLDAIPHISAVLLDQPLPESVALGDLLEPLASAGLTLVDACPRACYPAEDVQKAGVPVLRLAASLARDDGAGEEAERALARNLAVQRGYGLVVAPGTDEGLKRAETLIDTAKEDGLHVVFVEEAGRLHGLAPLPE